MHRRDLLFIGIFTALMGCHKPQTPHEAPQVRPQETPEAEAPHQQAIPMPQRGHREWIHTLELDGSGHVLLSGGRGSLRLWDLPNKRLMRHLGADSANYLALTMNAGGDVAAAVTDLSIHLWRLSDGEKIRTLDLEDAQPRALALSPDGKLLAASLTFENSVRIWNVRSGELLQSLTYKLPKMLAFSTDGSSLFISHERSISAWSLSKEAEVHRLDHGLDNLRGLVVDPSGQGLAALGEHFESASQARGSRQASDRHIRVWSLPHWKPRGSISGPQWIALSFCESPDRVLVSGWGTNVELWDLGSNSKVRTFLDENMYEQETVTCSADGRQVIAAGRDRAIRVWDAQTGELRHVFAPAFSGSTRAAALSPDSRFLAIATEAIGSPASHFVIWDLTQGTVQTQARENVSFVSFGQKTVVLGDEYSTLRGRDPSTSSPIYHHDFRGKDAKGLPDFETYHFAGSDGRYVLTIGGASPTLRIIDADTGQVRQTLADPLGDPNNQRWGAMDEAGRLPKKLSGTFALGPAGNLVATHNKFGEVLLLNLATRQAPSRLQAAKEGFGPLQFSLDGTLLAAGLEQGKVQVWATENSHKTHLLSLKHQADQLVFGPRGSLLAVLTYGSVEVWDLATERRVLEHVPPHQRIAFLLFASSAELILVDVYGVVTRLSLPDGKVLSRFGHCGPDSWYLLRQDGSVNGSRGGADCLAWTQGKQTFPFEQRSGRSRPGP